MRIARFDGGRIGVVTGDTIVDITDVTATGSVRELIARWADLAATIADSATASVGRPLADVTLDCPIPDASKLPSIPSNYRKHIAEMGSQLTVAERGVFLKAPSSLLGPGGTIRLPYHDRRTDHEAELGIVIGRTCRDVSVDDALDVVFGYLCLFDVTVRGKEERSMRKSFDTFTPIGPWITTADEVADPDDLAIGCWVNGAVRQESRTSEMIWSVPRLVSLVSSVMTLEPGDVIATGTPQGVGPITDGDTLAMEIEGLGRLELSVTAAGATACPFNVASDVPA